MIFLRHIKMSRTRRQKITIRIRQTLSVRHTGVCAAWMTGESKSKYRAFCKAVSLYVAAIMMIACFSVSTHAAEGVSISVYGVWHCSNDACVWGTPRSLAEFDSQNHWLIDRGDGQPSVNLVVLSFVHPVKLLNMTTDSATKDGIPRGITPDIISYFKKRNIRVMLSIGGVEYTDFWNQALAINPRQLGLNAAAAAQDLGVGIEIDYEEDTRPDLPGMQAFIDAYRSRLPYDPSGAHHAARLTIDLASGNDWLTDLARKAITDWLNPSRPVLDYANAMVPDSQPSGADSAQASWQTYVDGKPHQVPPMAPCKFTGSFYLSAGRKPARECTAFAGSLEDTTGNYVQTVAPKGAGTSPGMLGYMFWAAECQETGGICTTPPHTCAGGVGEGARHYHIPVPMPPLRQN